MNRDGTLNREIESADALTEPGSTRLKPRGPLISRLVERSPLDRALGAARDALLSLQHTAGYWLFELEADCTIPAEYILMMHFLGEIDSTLQAKLAVHLRARQTERGGWPLYTGGEPDISCSVKAYYALKLAGDSPDAPHMQRAARLILSKGGAARANVFTRIALALFGQVPWRAVPYIPVEIMLLPRWFPFHLDKVSYWSRAVMVPLFLLCTYKPSAKNPQQVGIGELFATPPERERHYFQLAGRPVLLTRAFFLLDRLARSLDSMIPRAMRTRATRKAEQWILERLNGEDGLGAIFPAMVNALEALLLLGYSNDDPRVRTAKRALQKLLVVSGESAYCQPCVSPIWDTALAALAMQEAGEAESVAAADRALDWMRSKQLHHEPGDWRIQRPDLEGGGWPFQFGNAHYPDLDDTAAIAWALERASEPDRHAEALNRALSWLVGMQSSNGGFAAFDVDNVHYNLNHIPFADHGALLDPPTSDVTARVVTALAITGRPQDKGAIARAIDYLRREQEPDGSWFGRWGTNYIYGTWSVLTAFAQARIGPSDEAVRRAVTWLTSSQNADGGWGESNDTYASPPKRRGQPDAQLTASTPTPSNPYQTAWALLALLASGESHSQVVERGIEYLLRSQTADGLWSDPTFTAPGFPRVFYLRYHGYCAYFPFWALAAYRNLSRAGSPH